MKHDELGARIHHALNEVGVTATEFARDAGVSQSYVSAVRRGKKKASIEMLQGLVSLYGFSAEWLLLGHGPRKKEIPVRHIDRGNGSGRFETDALPPEDPEAYLAKTQADLKGDIVDKREMYAIMIGIPARQYQELSELLEEFMLATRGTNKVAELRGYLTGMLAGLPDRTGRSGT